jgi:tRNA(Arg) A34 adenosine deaminase TadA
MELNTAENVTWMNRAIEVAAASVNRGNHPFGAVLVVENSIVLEAENTVLTEQDPTRHAEMNLVSAACRTLPSDALGESILFASTEPCAMCLGAIYWSGIKSVVFACRASVLEEIAGAGLGCRANTIFRNSTDPPRIKGPLLES